MYLCPPVCSTIPPYQTRVLLLFRRTGFFVSAAPDGSVVLLQPSDTPDTFCSSASWVVRPGLDGQEGSVSLESVAQQGESIEGYSESTVFRIVINSQKNRNNGGGIGSQRSRLLLCPLARLLGAG